MGQIQFSYSQKHILVTGGASGIGHEIARSFFGAGGSVTIWDYSQQALDQAKKDFGGFENRFHFYQVDVTNRESVQEAVKKLHAPIDVLINNAGITRDKSFAKLTDSDWDAVIATNLTGLYNVTKQLFEKFSSQSQNRRIINISSVVGLYGNFGQTNYAAAKAGVLGLTKTLGKELGRKGFTVNAIAPGFIATAMTKAMPKEVLDGMVAKVPVQRMGEVEDIATACLFLASEEASYINGTVLSVDGGLVI